MYKRQYKIQFNPKNKDEEYIVSDIFARTLDDNINTEIIDKETVQYTFVSDYENLNELLVLLENRGLIKYIGYSDSMYWD